MMQRHRLLITAGVFAAGFVFGFLALGANVERSQSAFTDYQHESPGTIRKITPADLPQL